MSYPIRLSMWDAFHSILHIIPLYICGSLAYDGVHALAHTRGGKRSWPIRLLAKAHAAHNKRFDRNLTINDKILRQTLLLHLPMELGCQMVGSGFTWALLCSMSGLELRGLQDLLIVWSVQTARAAVWGAEYHALHHIDPFNYYGSA